MKKRSIYTGFILGILLMPAISHAAEFGASEHYTLSSGQTVEQNLYAAGSDVMVAGTVEGDAYLAGGTVTMSGTIQKDLMMGGGTLTMNGTVNEDMRIAGGTIVITGTANGDVMIFGGQITITKDAKLAKDLYINGGQVTIDGTIDGPLTINGGTVTLNGTVNGNVTSHGDEFQLGSTAKINGDSNHTGPREQVVTAGATITGQKQFTKAEKATKSAIVPILEAWWLTKVAMLMVAALVFFMLFKRHNTHFIQTAITSFSREVLRGFVILVVLPIASIIALITVVGIPLAFLALCLYVSSIIIATIYANILAGNLVYKLVMKKSDFIISWQTIVVGVVVLQIIKLIPVLGWLAAFIVFLAAFGTLWNMLYRSVASKA
jgi:cytoskeletal protein CcmA (bactofilin family)